MCPMEESTSVMVMAKDGCDSAGKDGCNSVSKDKKKA